MENPQTSSFSVQCRQSVGNHGQAEASDARFSLWMQGFCPEGCSITAMPNGITRGHSRFAKHGCPLARLIVPKSVDFRFSFALRAINQMLSSQ